MPTVVPKLDEPVWGTQKRWEINRSNENKRIEWCSSHYEATRTMFRGGAENGSP